MPNDQPIMLDRAIQSGRIDCHIGARLRSQREFLRISQQALGQALGIAQHEIQNYENGTTPIEPNRLFDLSVILKVRLSYFFGEQKESKLWPAIRRLEDVSNLLSE